MSLPYLQPYLGLSNGLNTLHAAGGPGGAVGGWVELARTTLGSPSTTINVTSLPDKRYYMVLGDFRNTTTVNTYYRLNGDSGTNYAARRSENGGATDTNINYTVFAYHGGGASGSNQFAVSYIANKSDKEKLNYTLAMSNNGTGAGNAPNRVEQVGKHAQTSNPINAIQGINLSNTLATGSEVVVLGYDPADTHTNNFWEELASVEASGSSTNLSTGTFTAKKYLWVQVYLGAVAGNVGVTFNNDTGANYARRFSQKGGADSTNGSQSNFTSMMGIGNTWASFSNNFIINNASNEKLVIGHMNYAVGTGATNDPERMEFVGKWANTSNQITEIDFDSTSGNFPTSSIIKVWGAD